MKTKNNLRLIFALVAVAPVAAQAQRAVDRSIAGCYALSFTSWSRGGGNPSDFLPAVVHLDTMGIGDGTWRLAPNINYRDTHPFPGTPRWWEARDTVRLMWSDGFAAVTVTLVHEDSLWRGNVVSETDIVSEERPSPRASVTARRQSCEAPRSR